MALTCTKKWEKFCRLGRKAGIRFGSGVESGRLGLKRLGSLKSQHLGNQDRLYQELEADGVGSETEETQVSTE